MLKLINVTAFMVSFALGVFLVYTLEPTKQQVWIYASPKNASEIQFKAPSTDKCYDPVITNASCSLFAQDVDSEPSWFANATTFHHTVVSERNERTEQRRGAKTRMSESKRTMPKSRLKRLFYTKYGQLLLSCLLGLGLATVFRRACRSGNCVVHKVPSRSDMVDKVYKENGSCFKVSLGEAECDKSKKELILE